VGKKYEFVPLTQKGLTESMLSQNIPHFAHHTHHTHSTPLTLPLDLTILMQANKFQD
jgi:hypothetical protein